MNTLSKALIRRHLQDATEQILAMDTPDEALFFAVIDAQDAALTTIFRGRLPGFLVRRGIPRIQRNADGTAA